MNVTDRELIEALVATYPIHESMMGDVSCAWCDSHHTYDKNGTRYLHQWQCAWMRAMVHLGRQPDGEQMWGDRTWHTAWIDTKDRGWGLYGTLPEVGQHIAFIYRPSLEDRVVQSAGRVTELDGKFPIVQLEVIPGLDWTPAFGHLGVLPCIVWTDLDIADPRVDATSPNTNQKGNTE